MELSAARWAEEDLFREREKLFATVPKRLEVDINEVVRYFRSLPRTRFWDSALEEAERQGTSVVIPRLGYADIDEMNLAFRRVREEGGALAASIHIDSYTRWHRYDDAARLVEEGRKTKRNRLNGYPVVYHGVQVTREMLEAANMPVSSVTGSQDTRVLDELMIAAGVTHSTASIVPPAFTFTNNKVSLEQVLWNGLYTDRLIGWYQERGVPLVAGIRISNGGAAHPSSLGMAMMLVELLAAVKQGCRRFKITYYMNGSLLQDLATLRAAIPIAEKYLYKIKHEPCVFYLCGSHSQGVFPIDSSEAMAVLCYQALVSRLSGALLFHTKTADQGAQLPSIDAHVQSCKAMRSIMDIIGDFRFPDGPLEEECEMINIEVDALMDNMLELGKGDILVGFVNAIKAGTMEFPFSPSKYNKGEVMIARDAGGAGRFLSIGNLPLPDKSVRFHREKLRLSEQSRDELQLTLTSICNIGALRVIK